MMKIIDFDALFFEFARKWVVKHPGLNEEQIEDSYNTMMEEWMRQSDDRLGGATPDTYFEGIEGDELIELMKGYASAGVTIPEPLYTKIVHSKDSCEESLISILKDETAEEAIRAEAMGMLRDMSSTAIDSYLVQLVCEADESNELSDMAADLLKDKQAGIKRTLMDRYRELSDYAKMTVLDICSDPGIDERVYDCLIERIKSDPEHRAMIASYLAKLGDARAIETLKQLMQLYDITYFDYIEMRDAVEALGGEIEEERTFYGDPDYEALRNLE